MTMQMKNQRLVSAYQLIMEAKDDDADEAKKDIEKAEKDGDEATGKDDKPDFLSMKKKDKKGKEDKEDDEKEDKKDDDKEDKKDKDEDIEDTAEKEDGKEDEGEEKQTHEELSAELIEKLGEEFKEAIETLEHLFQDKTASLEKDEVKDLLKKTLKYVKKEMSESKGEEDAEKATSEEDEEIGAPKDLDDLIPPMEGDESKPESTFAGFVSDNANVGGTERTMDDAQDEIQKANMVGTMTGESIKNLPKEKTLLEMVATRKDSIIGDSLSMIKKSRGMRWKNS